MSTTSMGSSTSAGDFLNTKEESAVLLGIVLYNSMVCIVIYTVQMTMCLQ